MRLVNANHPTLKANAIYHKFEQPMPIYHNTEELYANEPEPIVENKEDLYNKYKQIVFPDNLYWYPVKGNMFIATGEKYVPETFTREGFIIYKTDGMNVVRTDNCYIRFFGILYLPGGARCVVTATGLWYLRPESRISAAVPPRLQDERGWNLKLNREIRSRSVDKITNNLKTGKKLTVMDYKFISKVLNPLAGGFFLNPLLSAKQSYRPNANPLSNIDLMQILASERVQKLILKELEVVMPELAKAIQDKSTPEGVAEMLQTIANDTIKKPDASVEDKLLSVQAILNAGYPTEGVTLNPPRDLMSIMPGNGTQAPAQNLIPYEVPKVMGGDEVEPKDKPTMEQLKKETDTLDGYTFEEVVDEKQPSAN